jgi:hypothetical protein
LLRNDKTFSLFFAWRFVPPRGCKWPVLLENPGRADTRKSKIHGVPNLSVGFLFHKGCIKFIKFKYIYILFSVSIHLNLDKFQAIFMKRRKYQIMITEDVVCS